MLKIVVTLICVFLLGFLCNSWLYLIPKIMVRFAKCSVTADLISILIKGFQEKIKLPKLNLDLGGVLEERREVRVLCWVMTGPANHYTKV